MLDAAHASPVLFPNSPHIHMLLKGNSRALTRPSPCRNIAPPKLASRKGFPMKTGTQGIARAVRFALGGSLGFATIFATPAVFAQSQTDDRSLETVYVTGSRIARTSDFENPSPVVTFDQDALQQSGYTNLQQLLEKQPFVGNGTFSTRGNNQDSTANGAASVSLRGLGADATLRARQRPPGRHQFVRRRASRRTSSTSTRSRCRRSSASRC